jgi:hypothetical protein
MKLLEKQFIFAALVPRLIDQAIILGYQVKGGEWLRSPEEAARLAKKGSGIKNSLHTMNLAIDLNLFRDGKYLTKTEDHRPLGEWWELQSTGIYTCHWGGRFGDGNHYSIGHNGVK